MAVAPLGVRLLTQPRPEPERRLLGLIYSSFFWCPLLTPPSALAVLTLLTVRAATAKRLMKVSPAPGTLLS